MNKQDQLKQEIFDKVIQYYNLVHKKDTCFTPKTSKVNYSGRVFDENELISLVDSSLEFWLTSGRYSKRFEKDLSNFLGVRSALMVNSGSSANLLAFMSLTSPLLKERQIKRGDEVITVAAGFPTTISPMVQYGAVPVFIDTEIDTLNIDVSKLEQAISSKTKAVMLAHTLGNPFDLKSVTDFCQKHNLWLIEDNCDALGAKYNGKYTGTFGDIGTSSFYPPHHITMGEGGATYTNNFILKKIMLSIRGWGRDCWCESGKDNTCRKRFSWQYGDLPFGYDHKYVYSHLGYNLKATDMQAAIGSEQLKKLPVFVEKRIENHQKMYQGLKMLEEFFIFPKATLNSQPSWFGFMLTIRDNTPFSRNQIVEYLESKNIQTRNLFAGNIIKHPCFENLDKDKDYRVIGNLNNTDKIMNNSFWVGVYPGLSNEAIDYVIDMTKKFIQEK